MPRLLDIQTDKVQEVTERELGRVLEQRQVAHILPAQPEGIRLWDNVSGGWTGPFNPTTAYGIYMKKLAFICSACRTPSAFRRDIESHIAHAPEQALKHQRARIRLDMRREPQMDICTGCKAAFDPGRRKAQRHLADAQAAGPKHVGARVLLIQAYSLGPGAMPTEVYVNGSSSEPAKPMKRLLVTAKPRSGRTVKTHRRRRGVSRSS